MNSSFSQDRVVTVAPPAISVVFGERLTALRLQNGFSLLSLAGQLDISVTALQQMESGCADPDLVLLDRIGQAFEMSVSDLLEGV